MTYLKLKLVAAATALLMSCTVISSAETTMNLINTADAAEQKDINAPAVFIQNNMMEVSDDINDALLKSARTAVGNVSVAITEGFMHSILPTIEESAPELEEKLWYRSQIPMKKEHQKLLWDCCQNRNLDYIDMLALISLESNFNEQCVSGTHKGYFQISTKNAANLSKTLNTENKPLDGSININWGTAYYSWILAGDRVKDLEGKAQRDAALSIYQRGSGGYDKYGLNYSFLKKYYAKRDKILAYFK